MQIDHPGSKTRRGSSKTSHRLLYLSSGIPITGGTPILVQTSSVDAYYDDLIQLSTQILTLILSHHISSSFYTNPTIESYTYTYSISSEAADCSDLD